MRKIFKALIIVLLILFLLRALVILALAFPPIMALLVVFAVIFHVVWDSLD